MRKVIIRGTPPADWVADAELITNQLRAAADEAERQRIIDESQGLWRDDRIRNWLLQQFNNKCWYTEAYESVSPYHVDHYRPKGRVKDLEGVESEGYWWLAFDWDNYRICGHMINSKKGHLFPIVEGGRATPEDLISLRLEAPLLIDPITDQTRLITYEKDEDACIAIPSAGITKPEEYRAEKTIELLGLNIRDRLNQKRAEYWEKCIMAIADYNVDGPQALRIFHQTSAITKLREMVAYNAEFSSVSEACIRKNAPGNLISLVFEHLPA
jgi:hypothetical protein